MVTWLGSWWHTLQERGKVPILRVFCGFCCSVFYSCRCFVVRILLFIILFMVNGCRLIRHEYEGIYPSWVWPPWVWVWVWMSDFTKSESRDVLCTTLLKRDYREDTCLQHYYTINRCSHAKRKKWGANEVLRSFRWVRQQSPVQPAHQLNPR